MKKLNLVALLLSMTLLFGMSQTASADNLCTSDIDNAKAEISWYADGFLSKNYDRDIDGLIGKLDAADGALNRGKADSARQKVGDALSKLDQWINAAKAKITPAAYEVIYDGLEAVLDCIDEHYQ